MYSDKLPMPKGNVRIALVSDGNIVSEFRASNLAVNGYQDVSIKLAGQDFTDIISKIAVGTGGHVVGDPFTPVVPLPADVALEAQLGLAKNIDAITFPIAKKVKFTATFLPIESNGDLTEAGLFSTSDIMVARVTFSKVIKTAANSLIVDWEVFF